MGPHFGLFAFGHVAKKCKIRVNDPQKIGAPQNKGQALLKYKF